MSAPPELHAIGSGIFEAFKALGDNCRNESRTAYLPSEREIAAEEQRFRLLAHSLGLHRKGHSSLDYRLREAVTVRDYLGEVLTELKEHLDNREWCDIFVLA